MHLSRFILLALFFISACASPERTKGMRAKIVYHPVLKYERLQLIKRDLKTVAQNVYFTGLPSKALELYCNPGKVSRQGLSCGEINEQLKDTLLTEGIIISIQSDTMKVAFADCLYPFDREYNLLTALVIKNKDGDEMPLTILNEIRLAVDKSHTPLFNEKQQPLIEFLFIADNKSEVLEIFNRHLSKITSYKISTEAG